jgi:hypothetical protein
MLKLLHAYMSNLRANTKKGQMNGISHLTLRLRIISVLPTAVLSEMPGSAGTGANYVLTRVGLQHADTDSELACITVSHG